MTKHFGVSFSVHL